MRNTRLAAAGLLAGVITLFSAGSAFAYGDDPVPTPSDGSFTVSAEPGGTFVKTGDFGGAEVESYTGTLLGEVIGEGQDTTTWRVEGTAPEAEGTYAITISTTVSDSFQTQSYGASSAATLFTAPGPTFVIQLVVGDGVAGGAGTGAGAGGAGALPDTGGANLLLVAGGAALVVAGAGVVAARRRNA